MWVGAGVRARASVFWVSRCPARYPLSHRPRPFSPCLAASFHAILQLLLRLPPAPLPCVASSLLSLLFWGSLLRRAPSSFSSSSVSALSAGAPSVPGRALQANRFGIVGPLHARRRPHAGACRCDRVRYRAPPTCRRRFRKLLRVASHPLAWRLEPPRADRSNLSSTVGHCGGTVLLLCRAVAWPSAQVRVGRVFP